MKVFILLSVVAVALANHQCGENEHYESCGTACPLTCDNFDNPPQVCVLRCDIGCHCDEGFVRSSDGQCVQPKECPQKNEQVCGENQRYLECGTACPLTCNNYANSPKFCPAVCVTGCHCEVGFVKTSDGRCVRPENCPSSARQVCGENQRYQECGTPCPLTCDNYANPPKICPAMCVTGCHCEEGYVKTREGGCVRPESCPSSASQVCGQNERFNSCGTDCPLTCLNYRNPPKFCNEMCRIGCECEEGYVKSRGDGRCVKPFNCPVDAHDHQTLKPLTDICNLPPVPGFCFSYRVRFYFDKESGKCIQFIYGGCRGNENNFKTIEECEKACA